MKKLSETVINKRKGNSLTQAQLADMTGINHAMIGRLENQDYTPSIDQLQTLAEVLGFEVTDMFEESIIISDKAAEIDKKYNIAVAETGYVGLSIATLLSQHNHVTAVDIIEEKVDMINNRKSPIQDDYIEKYLAEKELDLAATTDGETAYSNADFIVIAAPTNYDSKKNFFDCSAVESVIELVLKVNPSAMMIIKSTIPVGYTAYVREKYKTVFVTGSAGFIGSNLVLELLRTQSPINIIGLDNMNDYYDVSIKDWRLSEIDKCIAEHTDSSYSFYKGDLADRTLIDRIFENHKPDIVVNLAAQTGVRYSITNPDAYIQSNLIGFYNILEACRHSYDKGEKGVEHLVYASSSSVYGTNKKVPYSTDDKVDNPVSLYAATKKSN